MNTEDIESGTENAAQTALLDTGEGSATDAGERGEGADGFTGAARGVSRRRQECRR